MSGLGRGRPTSSRSSDRSPENRRRPAGVLPKLHVTNIPATIKQNDLRDIFKAYGKVEEVFLHFNAQSRHPTNWGFVTFFTFEDAEKAINDPPENLYVKYSTETLKLLETEKGIDISETPMRKMSDRKSSLSTNNHSPLSNGVQNINLRKSMSISGDIEQCEVCGKDGADLCMCCQMNFCSLKCANVIQTHKLVCVGVVDDSDKKSVSSFQAVPMRKSDVAPKAVRESAKQKRSLDSQLSTFEKNSNYTKDRRKPSINEPSFSEDSETSSKISPPKRHPKPRPQNREKLIESAMEDNEDKEIKCPLPLDTYTDVTVCWADKNSTFVLKTKDVKDLADLNTKLNKIKTSPASKLSVGMKCAAKYEGDLFRAKIVEVKGGVAKVFFVDFGNEDRIPANSIVELPSEFKVIKPFAISVKFVDGTKAEEGTEWSIIPRGLDNGIPCVEAKKNRANSDSDSELESPLSSNHYTQVEIVNVEKKDVYWVMTREGFNAALDLSDEIENSLPSKARAEMNRLFAVEIGGQWHRAKVVRLSPLTVFLIDSGTVEVVPNVFKLPENLSKEPPHAFKVKIEGSQSYHVMDPVMVKAIKKQNDTIIVEAEKVKEKRLRNKEGQNTEIDSGTIVTISSFESTKSIYLQVADEGQIKFINSVIEECENAPKLSEKPLCGELVACYYDRDHLYHRGKILKIKGDKYEVIFVDFGNVETVKIDDMKVLPEQFKNVPFCAVKIGLAGLPKSEFNAPATELMNLMATESKLLKIVHDGDLGNVQLLETNERLSLNEKLEEIMKKSWKHQGLNPKFFKIEDLISEHFEVGEDVTISTADLFSKNVFLGMVSNRKTCQDITEKLKEYQEGSIKPQIYEVCLAKNENYYYRAVCLEDGVQDSEMFFIDSGEILNIPHTKIYPIPYQLMVVPSTFKKFEFYGMENIPFHVQEKIQNLFRRKKFNARIVCDDVDSGTLFVPRLNEILKKQNLSEIVPPPSLQE